MSKYENYDIVIIITQRCNAKCVMCDMHENPSKPEDEIDLATLDKIPRSKTLSLTGGEPFLRRNIRDVVSLLHSKSKRFMINTNGFFTEKIITLCREFPDIGIRISMDGGKTTHDAIRGIDIYNRAMDTLLSLKGLGMKDVGVSFTMQENNYAEALDVYHAAVENGWDFTLNIVHNSFAFCKNDNEILHRDRMEEEVKTLVRERLRSKRIKDWARAFVDSEEIRFLQGRPMPFPCDAGRTSFFIDAFGKVLPCNMTPAPWVMGDLRVDSWDDIIHGERAERIAAKCKSCKIQCWSMCNMRTAFHKNIWVPAIWLLKNKFLGEY